MNARGAEIIGWIASVILCLSFVKQVYKQWHDDTSQGVSKWLYIGQIASEAGFIVYSWSLRSWVFFATNVFLLLSNFVGLAIVFRHRRCARRRSESETRAGARAA